MKAFCLAALLALGLGCFAGRGFAVTTNVYSTQFEVAEGYNAANDLAGQNNWRLDGTGGNGLIPNAIQGQSAYFGFDSPVPGTEINYLWRPINFDPLGTGFPIVTFSTQVRFVDSTPENGNYDFFQWRVYNAQNERLFTLDFDVYVTNINYRLDGAGDYVDTGIYFSFDTTYTLKIVMDFGANRWSATLDNTIVTTNLPITTAGAALNLGDVTAVWYLYDTNAPGDNYMIFDNFSITAESVVVPPAQLEYLGRTTEGWSLLRVFGAVGTRWALDATTNLTDWTALQTNQITGASFDVVDVAAAGQPRRFYRARYVP